jgi:hypothetical protein
VAVLWLLMPPLLVLLMMLLLPCEDINDQMKWPTNGVRKTNGTVKLHPQSVLQ